MSTKLYTCWLAMTLSLLCAVTLSAAENDRDKRGHGDQTGTGHATVPRSKTDQHDSGDGEHQRSQVLSDSHRHTAWEPPPPDYVSKHSTRWADLEAIARGKRLYQQNCMTCHGADGKGTGQVARALAHPPADLTQHLHQRPGDGDAYLFWRVSEGGTVEPFKSMGSAMPAFKTVLSEDERWDVLAYVHVFFHLGLAEWESATSNKTEEK